MTPLTTRQALAVTASSDADYRWLGLDRSTVEEWEDGARTDNRPGTYEWWYLDAHLDDGSTLVVVFMNKDIVTPGRPLSPILRLDLDLPDGRSFAKVVPFAAAEWAASRERADIRIGANRFEGDLHEYRIRAAAEEVSVDVTLTGDVPPWRPGTGHMLFGQDRASVFAWLPAVPQGRVSGSCTVDGVTTHLAGVGYHDHNWGNVALTKVVHHWYWARGQAGPYSIIASVITSVERYGYETIPVFMLAREGRIVADDTSLVRFEADGEYLDQLTGKPVAAVTRYVYEHDDDRIVVTFRRRRDLARARMVDGLPRPRRLLARLARFDGAYLRFAGDLTITALKAGRQVEEHGEQAVWELMYFGHARRSAAPPGGRTSPSRRRVPTS